MKHELLYETQSDFTAAQGNSGNVTSVTPGVAYVMETGSVPHFNKEYDDLVITYVVNDISSPTKLYNVSEIKTNLKSVIIDKEVIPVSSLTTTYQFENTGYHTVRYRYSSLTAIAASGFTNCSTITFVHFPDSLSGECFGRATFMGTSLEKVEIPRKATVVSRDAFSGCTKLNTIIFKNTSNITVDVGAFAKVSVTDVYVDSDEAWMNIYWNDIIGVSSGITRHKLYVNGEEVTTFNIPTSTTQISQYKFYGCYRIQHINLHDSITSIGRQAFCDCAGLLEMIIPSSLTQTVLSGNTFHNCYSISNFINYSTVPIKGISNNNGFGAGTGLFETYGDYDRSSGQNNLRFKNIIIHGNYTGGAYFLQTYYSLIDIKILGNTLLSPNSDNGLHYTYNNPGPAKLKFVEVLGNSESNLLPVYGATVCVSGCIVHLGYEGKISGNVNSVISSSTNTRNRVSKIYVGDGSSEEHDQAILQEYLADSDWSTVSSKLDIWYNYHGEYREE